ncbi:ABC transporter ATP-binding protein [uncultured Desulfosarcina sp.]|uniref:ABC transporter ATP-binding protein n=1 Tax=uncultured Desulfosarcina sp. TaxID=218289 RepID=UPI0029C93A71|nr:ABC transporter ATP-binding protein [uncultured Desulfosarcina sp.]
MTARLHLVDQRTEAMPVILEVSALSKRFSTNGIAPVGVLQDICFSVRRGEMICFLGRSGCGKSTLLKILAGFIRSSSGAVQLNGRPVGRPGPDRCVVFQEDALFPWLTVKENIAFGLKGRKLSRRVRDREVDRFIGLVGLDGFADYLPQAISGGMKQRVSLARVLILQPEVLLMDEPFAALDAQTREEMQNLLLDLWKKFSYTVLFVTHDVNEAVLLADRIILMDKNPGRIREDISIDLPRPRHKGSERYFERCRAMMTKVNQV